MKFKVGDVVRVRRDIEIDTHSESGVTFVENMQGTLGKYDIIERVDRADNTYKLVNNCGYWYAEEWLVELPQKGDEVTIVDDLREGDDYEVYVCSEMERFRGTTAEVLDCEVSRYHNRIEYALNLPGGWVWTTDMFKGFRKGEGETEMDENMELTTLMDKTVNYDFDPSVINVLTDAAIPFLQKYDYNATEFGVKEIIKEWERQKAWLIALMCKHEYYNGNFQIVIPAKLKEPIDVDNVISFKNWAITEFEKSYKTKEVKIGMFTYAEVMHIKRAYYRIWDNLLPHSTLNGFPREYYGAEYNRYDNMLDKKINELGGIEEIYLDDDRIYLSTEDYKNIRRFRNIMTELFNGIGDSGRENPHLFTDVQAYNVNELAKLMGLKVKAAEGQKLSKYIGKLLKETGLNHVVDIQKTTWTDSNTGEVHERVKDMGYNYYFALIGDSINPKEFETEVVLSVNPFDFWTMSFGDSWASCMTIDKNNSRHVDGQHNYQGMYSAGTESYMLDNSAIIVYTRPTKKWLEEHGESELPLEIQSKHKRGVFLLGEDKIVQCRTYPDGRDGGDNSLPAQLREIVQKTFADLLDTPNMWLLKKGSSECRKVTVEGEGYTHYRDYVEYDDGTVSYLKRVNGNLNRKKMTVGAYAICPECGERHDSERHITCDNCFEKSEGNRMCCDRCGECYDENDEDAIVTSDGHHYCCAGCANADNYVWCYDTGNWIYREDTYFDDWTQDYYEYNEEGVYIHDNWYHNEETAREAGWQFSDWDEDWYDSDDVFEIGDTGMYFSISENTDYVEIEVNGRTIYYPTSERAEDDGYTYDEENDEWVAA